MRFIRYLNLFERHTGVSTKNCFEYNSNVIFVVPGQLVSRAIGENGNNMKGLREVMGKNIKVIAEPMGIQDVEKFVKDIIEPLGFKSIDARGEEIVINAGTQYKASLIGRNKTRLMELKEIIKSYFGKELRIM